MTDCIIIIPTFNNGKTIEDVLQRTLSIGLPVMVVDDGCTDETPSILNNYTQIILVRHQKNKGKGAALKSAFRKAASLGYKYAVTIDSDGQHYPEDIPLLLARRGERTLVVGCRNTQGVGGSATFANKLSNNTFTAYSGIRLPDTQTGFRLYPLESLPPLWVMSSRYEAELSLLMFSAWKGLKLVPVPVKVNYPKDRISHFRPFEDFTRISILNTVFLFIAIVYGYPRILFRKLFGKYS